MPMLKLAETDACSAPMQVMPIYEMTRQRPNFHGGSFGRGVSKGQADCKHYCSGMLDWWNIVLYNMLW